jgi:hypothetical protein
MWSAGVGAGVQQRADHQRQQVAIVMVKVQTTWGGKKGWYGFGSYLTRKGGQRQEKGEGFNRKGPVKNMAADMGRWQHEGDRHFFDVVVSLGSLAVDLPEFTRRLMREKVEPTLGQSVEWMAIDHHDKAHHHVHLVIRGRDGQGKTLRIDGSYLWGGLRQQVRELATQAVGWRTAGEIADGYERSLRRTGWNGIDKQIKEKKEVLTENRLSDHEKRRLLALQRRGLAWRDERGEWQLAQRWEDELRAEGRGQEWGHAYEQKEGRARGLGW